MRSRCADAAFFVLRLTSGIGLSLLAMKIPISSRAGLSIWVDFRRQGLAFISEFKTLDALPSASATLLLRWSEVFVISLILGIGDVAVRYRNEIINSWLISDWAVHNTTKAATATALLALAIGLLLALWKRRQLFVYSIWEIVFGAFSAFQIGLLLFPAVEMSKLIGLASALYVISRGGGNLADALQKETEVERVKLKMVSGAPREPWPPSVIPKSEFPS